MSAAMVPTGRTESKYANGISYVFEYLDDGWIGIYEHQDGLPLRPIIQACNEEKALEFITLRERVSVPVQRLV